MFEKAAILGLGFMGASLAQAIKKNRLARLIAASSLNKDDLDWALAQGLVDAAENNENAVRGADLVVLAAPPRAFASIFAEIAPVLPPQALITDLASTKEGVLAQAKACLGTHFPRFVAAHPLAGSERFGARAAKADLFLGAKIFLCPDPSTEKEALEQARSFWQALGAKCEIMEAARHDEVMGWVSHLPQVLVFAYLASLAGEEKALRWAGKGFSDFTRLGASSPELWADIALANRQNLETSLGRLMGVLEKIKGCLDAGDTLELAQIFALGRKARICFEESQKPGSLAKDAAHYPNPPG